MDDKLVDRDNSCMYSIPRTTRGFSMNRRENKLLVLPLLLILVLLVHGLTSVCFYWRLGKVFDQRYS